MIQRTPTFFSELQAQLNRPAEQFTDRSEHAAQIRLVQVGSVVDQLHDYCDQTGRQEFVPALSRLKDKGEKLLRHEAQTAKAQDFCQSSKLLLRTMIHSLAQTDAEPPQAQTTAVPRLFAMAD